MKLDYKPFKDALTRGLINNAFNLCSSKVPNGARLIRVTNSNCRLIGCCHDFDDNFLEMFGSDECIACCRIDSVECRHNTRHCHFFSKEDHDNWNKDVKEIKDKMAILSRRHERHNGRGGRRGVNVDRQRFLVVQKLAEAFRLKWTLIGMPLDVQKTMHDDQMAFQSRCHV